MSNILMYDVDVLASEIAAELGVVYTRYADDVAASCDDAAALIKFETRFRRIIKNSKSLDLEFNDQKRGLYGPGQRQFLTGLVLTPMAEISIGRDRKREIKALLHQLVEGRIDQERLGYLKGMLGFVAAVEPEFLGRLRVKYGDQAVSGVMSYRVPRREV